MDFDQLATFVYVAKLKSFSRAGQKVFRSQSAVSAQIRQLEQAYRARLLDRSAKSVELTPAGEAYIGFARANPGLYRLMFGDGFRSTSTANAEVRAMRQRAYKVVAESLQKRLPADQVPIAALFLWSLVHGLALLLIDGQLDSGGSPAVIIQNILRMAGTGLPTSS